METRFTEQESLAVISEMIDRARNNIQKGNASSMIFWGFAVALTAILNYILLQVLENHYYSYYVWYLMFPFALVGYFINRKVDKASIVKTQIDGLISATWKAYSISVCIFIFSLLWLAHGLKNYQFTLLINPVIMVMVALAQFVTAKACRFKPFLYGTIIMWLGAIACVICLFIFKRIDTQFLILAVCMILSFVVPGYLLNKKAKEHV